MANLNRGTRKDSPSGQVTQRSMPRLSAEKREFVGRAISKEIRAGKPRKQAIAIGFSVARKRFGNSGLQATKTIKNRKTDNVDKRTRSLLFTLLGTAIALRILRQITKWLILNSLF